MVHELIMAERIRDAVLAEVRRHGARSVTRVRIRLGALEGVAPAVLREAFEAVTEGTLAAGADLEVEQVRAQVRCEGCGTEPEAEGPVHGGVWTSSCPRCGGPVQVLQGRGWELVSVRAIT
jgi:hydrogenase nickel incorporation protein HypA/HybF